MIARDISTDPIAAYIQGAESRLERMRRFYHAHPSREAYERVLEAVRHVRRARLDHYGVDCPTCRGAGYLRHRTDPTYAAIDCPEQACNGEGVVLPAEAEKIRGRARERDYSDDEIRGIR